jgi:acyl-CoA thioester hydrolase
VNTWEGLEVWRGSVNTWECDEMGHLNVRFYVARAAEGLAGLADALGLENAFRREAEATLIIRDHHIRFLREARAGAPLVMVAGLLELGDCEARILQLLYHARSGELAAAFQTVVSHVTARELRAFPWSNRTRERAPDLFIPLVERAAPRSLGLGPSAGQASVQAADRLGLVQLGSGAFGAQDCDVFGRIRPELIVARISDGVPHLPSTFASWDLAAPGAARLGGAVLEQRLAYNAWPRAGDRFAIRSGLAGFDSRTRRLVHWILDPSTGLAWASAEAVVISLDLEARAIVPIDDHAKIALAAHISPGLSF